MRGAIPATKHIRIKLSQKDRCKGNNWAEEEEEEEEQHLLRRRKPCTEAHVSVGSGLGMDIIPIVQERVVVPTPVESTLMSRPEAVETVPMVPIPEVATQQQTNVVEDRLEDQGRL